MSDREQPDAVVLNIYTVYENPLDFPRKFVVRRHELRRRSGSHPTSDCAVVETLDDARDTIPSGLIRMVRHPDDDPCIVETWM